MHTLRGNLQKRQVGVLCDVAELDCGRIDADVDLTGLKRDNTGGSFGHNTEGQVLGGLDAAVVVLKCMHGDVVAVRPGIEDVRAAADGVAVGFVRFHGSLVQDAERRIRNIIKDIADLVFQNDLTASRYRSMARARTCATGCSWRIMPVR